MDHQTWTDELSSKIRSDRSLLRSFHMEPNSTVAELVDIDLPEERMGMLVQGVKINMFLKTVASLFPHAEGDRG